MAQPQVAERRYVPLSAAEAVLRYASSFLPSWAGAISIDLLPAVLVGIMSVVYASIRRDEAVMSDAERLTAADLLRSLDVQRALTARQDRASEPEASPQASPENPVEEPSPGENVTPISLNERKRQEP